MAAVFILLVAGAVIWLVMRKPPAAAPDGAPATDAVAQSAAAGAAGVAPDNSVALTTPEAAVAELDPQVMAKLGIAQESVWV